MEPDEDGEGDGEENRESEPDGECDVEADPEDDEDIQSGTEAAPAAAVEGGNSSCLLPKLVGWPCSNMPGSHGSCNCAGLLALCRVCLAQLDRSRD